MKMIISVSKCLKRNFKLTKVSVTCKNYILLSKKTPKFKYWLLKFLCLETQMVWFGWVRNWLTLFVFVALTKMLCCCLMQWTGTWDTKTRSRRPFTTLQQQMHHASAWILSATLEEFLDGEIKEHVHDEKFNYCQWNTTDSTILTNFTATYKEYKETLIYFIDDFLYRKIKKLPVLDTGQNLKLPLE